MILYLTITALLNIGLGFGLAVYLGYARSEPASLGDVEGLVGVPLWSPAHGEGLPAYGDAGSRSEELNSTAVSVGSNRRATPSRNGHDLEAETQEASPQDALLPEVEQATIDKNLLAGIEQFRNQLAQIKGKVEPVGEKPTPQPA